MWQHRTFLLLLISLIGPILATHCSNNEVTRKKDSYHSASHRQKRQITHNDSFITGLYFNGTDQTLKLTRPSNSLEQDRLNLLPADKFTVELWLTPEGGQPDQVVIAGMADLCAEDMAKSVWEFGIRSKGSEVEKSGFYSFSLKTEMARVQTTVDSIYPYQANQLTHLAASYNGSFIRFYVNGAQVAVSKSQTGSLFSGMRNGCHHIFLGGAVLSQRDSDSGHFRGSAHLVRIWKRSLTAAEISQLRDLQLTKVNRDHLVFQDLMESFDQWALIGDSHPVRTKIVSTHKHQPLHMSITQCGQTICDNPEMVLAYDTAIKENKAKMKTIRYRIVNILDDSGANPIVSDTQIHAQHRHVLDVFKIFNISWHLDVVYRSSSALRHRKILLGCDPLKVGNNQCDPECSHELTNFDGGDCNNDNYTVTQCPLALMANHQCDSLCNRPEFQWDGGDCCNRSDPNVFNICLDPTSPYRRYLDVDEYKTLLNMSSKDALTVSFAQFANTDVIGLSTFPWDKDVFTINGGIIIQPNRFGTDRYKNHLVHEIGHALGLWHVHHGVSEMSCDDPCRETEASMLTGDLAEDTQPTPKNVECRDPTLDTPIESKSQITTGCSLKSYYTNTPYSNYMSYADESCTDNFTPHQMARMRCYLDLTYTPFVVEMLSLAIPLPIQVVSKDASTVTIGWMEPLGIPICRPSASPFVECLKDGRVAQYATKAVSPGQKKQSGFWAPIQASGPPDAEICSASTKAWLREESVCSHSGNCWLELEFELPVVPEKIQIWLPWNAHEGIRVLKLHFLDMTSRTVENLSAQCDTPLTITLVEQRVLYKVEIHTSSPFVSIDAMEVISKPNEPLCSHCRWPSYRVWRQPTFAANHSYKDTITTVFNDQLSDPSVSYSYQIQPIFESEFGDMSKPLVLHYQDHICGDGLINRSLNEECDDGNLQNNDGCSSKCKVEVQFNCKGEPSICYAFKGDGICEDFERLQSVSDCGYYTPEGFVDFWPTLVVPLDQSEPDFCPHSFLVGPPVNQGCSTVDSDGLATWKLCTKANDVDGWKIQAFLENPILVTSVIVHLASDGGGNSNFLTIELIAVDNTTTILKGAEQKILSCTTANPTEYVVSQDLSEPFKYSRAVVIESQSPLVVLSGVRLRSFRSFDPVALQHCAKADRLYNPRLNSCSTCKCSSPPCQPLTVGDGVVLKCKNAADGEICKVSCADGYQFQSGGALELETVCVGGKWSKSQFLCLPIDCGVPTISFANVVCPQGTNLHHNCTFTCKPPANLIGSSTVISCGSNGLWTPPQAFCRLLCGAPIEPLSFARSTSRQCRVSSQLQIGANSLSYPIGTRCKFVCRPGFHVEGQSAAVRNFKRVCSDGAKWKGPKCSRVKCVDPRLKFSLNHNCTNGYKVGSECKFACPDSPSQLHSAVCQPNGTWSSAVVCKITLDDCPFPAPPRDLSVKCPNHLQIGSVCQVSCNVYGYEPVVESWVPTDMGVNLQLLQSAAKLVCTAQKFWDFDVQTILCVRKCSTEFLRDGWCDFQNNRGYCGYDGGDCCASTAKGNKVRLMFPSLCTSHLCRCLDPYAIENRNDLVRAKMTLTALNYSEISGTNGYSDGSRNNNRTLP